MLTVIRNALSSLSSPSDWLVDWVRGGSESDAGVNVNTYTSTGFPPIWYAVSKIAGHVGQLPLNVHKRLDRGSDHAPTHPAYRLLKTRPNDYQTSIVFREQVMLHSLINGNGRAAILRRNGVPAELIPLLPGCTWTCLVNGKKWHIVECDAEDRCLHVGTISPGSSRDGRVYKIPDSDVLHIPGLGYDGIQGYSLKDIAKDSIGLGLAAQKATARTFRNGSKPGVVIEAPVGAFRDNADAKEFIDNFNEYHEGLDNQGRAALMREGMTLTTLGISASDAEWLGQRQFQRQEIAMLFGIESMPGDESSVSYNSLEQKNMAYLSAVLMKWLIKWEQECDEKLLGQRAQRTHFCKFNTGALLRSDYKSTVDALGVAITMRIMSPNEAREKLDMNPYNGGDVYENPAITPGGSPADDDTKEPADESMTPEESNQSATAAHLRHMIGTEANRVLAAAGNNGNYSKWLDKFYSQWQPKLSAQIKIVGGTEQQAIDHCRNSQDSLIELLGSVTPEGLAEAIEELTSSWPARADSLAAAILTKELTNV